MGNSYSKTQVDSLIDAANQVITQYEQSCTLTDVTVDNDIIIGTGCTVGPTGGIYIKNNQAVNLTCINENSNKANLSASIAQSIRSASESIIQQFSFLTFSEAETFINSTLKLGDTIYTTYYDTCGVSKIKSTNNIVCEGTVNGIVEIDNFQSSNTTCVFKNVTESSVYQEVISNLQASAVAQQQSTFTYIMFAFVFVLAIFAWIFISITNNPVTQWIIVGFILFSVIGSIIYTATARSSGNYPYKKA